MGVVLALSEALAEMFDQRGEVELERVQDFDGGLRGHGLPKMERASGAQWWPLAGDASVTSARVGVHPDPWPLPPGPTPDDPEKISIAACFPVKREIFLTYEDE